MDTGNEKLDRVGQSVRPGCRFLEHIIGMLMRSFFFIFLDVMPVDIFPMGNKRIIY